MFAEGLKGKFGTSNKFLRTAPLEIDTLTHLYLQETYSAHAINREERRQAAKIWRRLFWRLLYVRILNRLSKAPRFPGNSLHKD
jgi:hypothetical protein